MDTTKKPTIVTGVIEKDGVIDQDVQTIADYEQTLKDNPEMAEAAAESSDPESGE